MRKKPFSSAAPARDVARRRERHLDSRHLRERLRAEVLSHDLGFDADQVATVAHEEGSGDMVFGVPATGG
jgi:hypothetical protein